MDGVFDTLDRESFLRWADVAEMYMDEADAGGSDHLVCVARKVLGGKDRQMDYEGGEEEIVKEEGRKEEGGKGMVNGVNTRGFSCEEG